MRTILFLLISCLTFNATAQCKYVKTTKDEWSGKTMNTAQMTIGAAIAGREVILQKSEDGKYYLSLRITYNMDFPEVTFKKGDKVSFKLSNGDLIEITPPQDVTPFTLRFLDVPIRHWIVTQEVKTNVYEQLATAQITAIKYRLNGNEYPLPEIKDRQTQKIMETAKCMLTDK